MNARPDPHFYSYCDLSCPVCRHHLLAASAFMLGGEEQSSWRVRRSN